MSSDSTAPDDTSDDAVAAARPEGAVESEPEELDTPVEVEVAVAVAVAVAAPDASDGAPVTDLRDQRIAQLEAALTKAEQDKKDTWDKFLRASADIENQRRRSKRDLDDARSESRNRVLKEMLPVVDNLERALQHAEDAAKGGPSDAPAIIDGVRLVLRQFAHAFERLDVTQVEAEGKPFDPNLHEAISQLETADHPPGTVVTVLQRGYKLGDRLLRPALVVVARAKAEPAEPGAQA